MIHGTNFAENNSKYFKKLSLENFEKHFHDNKYWQAEH